MNRKKKNFLTIGTFDGVHIGHQFLFGRLEALSVRHRQRPQILYFPLPPKTLLGKHPEMTVLSLENEKKKLLSAQGISASSLDFEKCRNISPNDFFENVLLKQYNMGGLLIGKDFAFGKNREGDADFLREKCARYNIPFEVIDFYLANHQKVSSSLIRKTLAMGDIPYANELLGRNYQLSGRVIKGHQLGRKLGFPTANLDTGIYKILPLGVFAVKVKSGKNIYNGFCNIGFRPTVNTIHASLPLVEVNIFNFNKNIYGRNITISFVEKLRDEMKFNGLDHLTDQLKKDKENALKILLR